MTPEPSSRIFATSACSSRSPNKKVHSGTFDGSEVTERGTDLMYLPSLPSDVTVRSEFIVMLSLRSLTRTRDGHIIRREFKPSTRMTGHGVAASCKFGDSFTAQHPVLRSKATTRTLRAVDELSV
jgi:hypothetical protein